MESQAMKSLYQLLLLWYVIWISAAVDCNGEIDTTCPTDCSQFDRRVAGDNTILNCTIGGIDSIKRFKEFNPSSFLPDKDIFDAPKLRDISLYKRNKSNPSLKINFQLPKGVKKPYELKTVYPKAVLLKFESIADKKYQDSFYYNCPRHRIFRFHDYKPETNYDSYHPRNLTFDCLVGLSMDNGQLKVYKITLETVEGKSVTYTVTVNVIVADLQREYWQTVIATEVDEEKKTIYVVFQKLQGKDVLGYVVTLEKAGQSYPETVRRLPAMNNTVLFENVSPGQYNVLVSVKSTKCSNTQLCMNSTSYAVLLPGSKDGAEDTLKIVVMILGCVLGAAIGLPILVWWIRRKERNKNEVCGWLIHPFEQDPDKLDVIEKLTEYIEASSCCHIRSFKPEGWSKSASSENELKEWCEETLTKYAKFVIIIIYENAFRSDRTCALDDYYSYTVQTAVNKKKTQNSIRIFSVHFTHECTLPHILIDSPHYPMMMQSSQLCQEIYNLSDMQSSKQPLLPDDSERKQALTEAIEKSCSGNRTTSPVTDRNRGLCPPSPVKNRNPKKGPNSGIKIPYSLSEELKKINELGDLLNIDELGDNKLDMIGQMDAQINDDINTKKQAKPKEVKHNVNKKSDPDYVTCIPSQISTQPNLLAAKPSQQPFWPPQDGSCPNSDYVVESDMHEIIYKGKMKQNTIGYVGHGLIERSPSHMEKGNQFDTNDVHIPHHKAAVQTPLKLDLPGKKNVDKHDTLSESKGEQTEILKTRCRDKNSMPDQYVTQDRMVKWEKEQEDQQWDEPGATGFSGTIDTGNYITQNETNALEQHKCPNYKQNNRKQKGFGDRNTYYSNPNHTEHDSSSDLHIAYVPHQFAMGSVHPTWKHRLGTQQNGPEIHDNLMLQDNFDCENRLYEPPFAVNPGNQHLGHNGILNVVDSCHRPRYEETGQYVPHGHMLMGQHAYHLHGQPVHQHHVGAEQWQNFAGTDIRRNLVNQDYVSMAEYGPGHHKRTDRLMNVDVRRNEDLEMSSSGACSNKLPLQAINQGIDTSVLHHNGYIRRQCHRVNSHVSDRSDSILSADDNLEYETSCSDIDPQSYVSSDQMNRIESDRQSSGYLSRSLEHQTPNALEMSTLVGQPVNCRDHSSTEFIHALNVEGSLREEYDSFDPIPPEADQSPNGSISELMDEMEKFNSR